MMRAATTQNPLLPTSYDVLWSVSIVAVLVATGVLLVTALRSRRRRPGDATSEPVRLVRQLAGLRDAGAITPEEYEARKNRLLGPI